MKTEAELRAALREAWDLLNADVPAGPYLAGFRTRHGEPDAPAGELLGPDPGPPVPDGVPLGPLVEALTYHGTGDEGVELFRQTCGLAYMMNGVGTREQAVACYLWAKQMAEESRRWCEEHEPGALGDTEQGTWGYP